MKIKKLKFKPIKNKKILFALVGLAIILLSGITFNLVKNMFSLEDTCKVVIKYNTLDCNGNSVTVEKYQEEHKLGERINVVSPEIAGYEPDKEKVITVVKSDLQLTVNYSCLHAGGFSECVLQEAFYDGDQWHSGTLLKGCEVCGNVEELPYYQKSYTIIFGGEDNLAGIDSSNAYNANTGYGTNQTYKIIYADSIGTSEFDELYLNNLIAFGEAESLPENVICTIEYDESVWGEGVISIRPKNYSAVYTDYYIRIGKSWRVIFGSRTVDVNDPVWFTDENCLLAISPIKVTLTYDMTK